MNLYKIINQLTDEEYNELHSSLVATQALKTISFLECIKEDPISPDKLFLEREDVNAAAFYVLKSRLADRIEDFLLQRLGGDTLALTHRVLTVSDLVFDSTREIAEAALGKLEKELIKNDFPYGLMLVYKELQNVHNFGEEHAYYKRRYQQQVAYAVAMDKAEDLVREFFKVFDEYELKRRDRDLTTLTRIMEKLSNLSDLYDSHRLYFCKGIVHLFALLFIEIPDTIRCDLEPAEDIMEKLVKIQDDFKDDPTYRRLDLIVNFLRYSLDENKGRQDNSHLRYGILDDAIEKLLTGFHFNINASLFLFAKLRHHIRNKSISQLRKQVDGYVGKIPVDTYRVTYFLNYNLFKAYALFLDGDYHAASRVLFDLQNEVNLRNDRRAMLNVKLLQIICYVKMEDFDLANAAILAMQRKLRQTTFEKWENAKTFLRIMNVALGGRPKTMEKNLRSSIDKWNEENKGAVALLEYLDLDVVFNMKTKVLQHS
ncbi:MAG: hypothetical protein NWR72_13325 [Bacteroidia bacterium]|nr:hypothetical protein [Bacteroidia bacterium]